MIHFALHKKVTARAVPRGFTLVETMVAISVLLVALMGPMTIAAKGLKSAFFAREQVTAVYLAQEAIEFIRAKRDGYALLHQGDGIDTWLSSTNIHSLCKDPAGIGCGIDMRTFGYRNCGVTGTSCRLRYDASAITNNTVGMYNYATGVLSPYTRIVTVRGDDDEAVVNVTVSWQSGLTGGTRSVELESYLFNQYDSY